MGVEWDLVSVQAHEAYELGKGHWSWLEEERVWTLEGIVAKLQETWCDEDHTWSDQREYLMRIGQEIFAFVKDRPDWRLRETGSGDYFTTPDGKLPAWWKAGDDSSGWDVYKLIGTRYGVRGEGRLYLGFQNEVFELQPGAAAVMSGMPRAHFRPNNLVILRTGKLDAPSPPPKLVVVDLHIGLHSQLTQNNIPAEVFDLGSLCFSDVKENQLARIELKNVGSERAWVKVWFEGYYDGEA